MDVLLVTVGSSGDVHPFVGIGIALQRRGHRVALAANGHFQSLVSGAGLEFIELGSARDYEDALADADLWHMKKGFRRVVERGILPLIRPGYEIVRDFQQRRGGVVAAHGIAFGARVAQEKWGVPLATIHLAPVVFRSVYASPKLPGVFLPQFTPAILKRWIYSLGDRLVLDRTAAGPLNEFRAELGLAPVKSILGAWWHSPQRVIGLFPPWYAEPQPDWPPNTVLTGFPLYDAKGVEETPAALARFLDEGDAPIVMTPGTAMRHAGRVFAAFVDVCRASRRRGILLTRFPEQIPRDLPEGVRHFPYAPLSDLLPRAAAFVHHGGIGTTSQALAGGVPQVVTAFAHDQPDNAIRVQNLGVGKYVKPADFRMPFAQRALEEVMQPGMRRRCAEIAARFHDISPLEETCRLIEALDAKGPG